MAQVRVKGYTYRRRGKLVAVRPHLRVSLRSGGSLGNLKRSPSKRTWITNMSYVTPGGTVRINTWASYRKPTGSTVLRHTQGRNRPAGRLPVGAKIASPAHASAVQKILSDYQIPDSPSNRQQVADMLGKLGPTETRRRLTQVHGTPDAVKAGKGKALVIANRARSHPIARPRRMSHVAGRNRRGGIPRVGASYKPPLVAGEKDARARLTKALTNFTDKQFRRHIRDPRIWYNPNSERLYLESLDEALAEHRRGTPLRRALEYHFEGPVLKAALKAVGES